MNRLAWVLGAGLILILGGWLAFLVLASRNDDRGGINPLQKLGDLASGRETYTTERTDYQPPVRPVDAPLVDDRIEDKTPEFDPALVHPVTREGWSLNYSAAVFRLDVPMVLPDSEGHLLELHPSYADAAKAAQRSNAFPLLPSVNMIDGKAKQFDDGLYSAIDLASFEGLEGTLKGHLELFERTLKKVGADSPAAPFLAAGLSIAGRAIEGVSPSEVERLVRAFEQNPVASKPIGVYTWSPELSRCFRVLRFYQQPFLGDLTIPRAIADALATDPELLADYRAMLAFYSKLTNPLQGLSAADLIGRTEPVPELTPVALLPASTSRETELFLKLFPLSIPPDVDLMKELVRRIKSGEVDLTPRADSGWYDRQVYALQTLLLPEMGRESTKLLLTRPYKERMLEAFKALITKRRETHVRQLAEAKSPSAMVRPPTKPITPQLRLEPNATYYLRTARAYGFLANFLEATISVEALGKLHGLEQGGEREPDLRTELQAIRDLFLGCYLAVCEDIGLKPEFDEEESSEVDRDRCLQMADDWLKRVDSDPDLAIDTRVSVPISSDPIRRKTRLWTTLGVRLAKLDVSFARPPSMKPVEGEGDWEALRPDQMASTRYLIPVDEFAEVELNGLRVFNRDEFRGLCDEAKTKEAIVRALRSSR